MDSWAETAAAFGVEENVPLAPITTYKMGGPARWYWEPPDGETLARAAGAAARCGVETTVLGRGSNAVVSDVGFDGLVIRLAAGFRDIEAFRGRGTRWFPRPVCGRPPVGAKNGNRAEPSTPEACFATRPATTRAASSTSWV